MSRRFEKPVWGAVTAIVVASAMAGLTGVAGADARPGSPGLPAPNSNQKLAPATGGGPVRSIAPGGTGRVTYLGKSKKLSSLPDAGPGDVKSGSRFSALQVPHWFKGKDVGATLTKADLLSSSQPQVTTPTVVRLNKGGTKDSQSSCSCQPPDTNGAISSTRIVEAVNLSLTVYTRAGALISRKSLASFFPTNRAISDPRVEFDNRFNRWILVFIPIPETTSTTPQLYLAVSTSSDPNGSYFKYTISFSGGLFPAGTLLDYPMVGQSADAAIVSTNNFQRDSVGGFNYVNSTAFAIPKSLIYSGSGFSFPAFAVSNNTHPAVARGKPMKSYTNSYLVAPNSNGGFNLYAMAGTGGSSPTLTLQGTTSNSLWSPPPPASQPAPNSAVQLDTLDGRLQAPPVQTDSFVWFAHTVKLASFPGVQYGALSLSGTGTGGVSATTQYAFESSTSDDWNPSIAVSEPASNSDHIFLDWTVTDPPARQNVSLRVSGVGPGEGVPNLGGIGTTLFTGGGSPSQTRFGDYSSATIDVKNVSTTCKYNTQALVVNEVFNAGDWQARLARVGTC